jgi:hypothetical protein
MTITVLKDLLVGKNQIDKIFEKSAPVNLWRALNVNTSKHPFDFVEQPFILSNGRPRQADITIEVFRGQEWVRIKERPRGLSTFDRPGIASGKNWQYYKIPKGTRLPYGLAIVRDEYNTYFDANHYTIAPAFDMPLVRFKLLLNQLAEALVKEAA